MEWGVSNRVIARNSFGRFEAAVDAAVTQAIEETVQEGAQLSRDLAPRGTRHDRRTIPLADSIETRMISRTAGEWYSTARHALPQERGARPHMIVGDPTFQFYWENRGRWWIPGLFGEPDVVMHPGHGAQPFLRPAYDVVKRSVPDKIARRVP